MKIFTKRLGEITVDADQIIEMKAPILGFEQLKRFVILTEESNKPFSWFQSIENEAIAFLIVNAELIKADYNPDIPKKDLDLLEGEENDQGIFKVAILTLRRSPFAVTANLRAPIVINLNKRLAKQIVLEDDDYPIRYTIYEGSAETGENKDNEAAGIAGNKVPSPL